MCALTPENVVQARLKIVPQYVIQKINNMLIMNCGENADNDSITIYESDLYKEIVDELQSINLVDKSLSFLDAVDYIKEKGWFKFEFNFRYAGWKVTIQLTVSVDHVRQVFIPAVTGTAIGGLIQ